MMAEGGPIGSRYPRTWCNGIGEDCRRVERANQQLPAGAKVLCARVVSPPPPHSSTRSLLVRLSFCSLIGSGFTFLGLERPRCSHSPPRPLSPPSLGNKHPLAAMNPRPLAPAPSTHSNPSLDPSLQLQAGPSTVSPSSPSPTSASASTAAAVPKVKKPRRSKVAEACRFCRRSHMSCDAGRPCGRCVKRDIAHLCRDEPATLGGPPAPPAAPSSPQVAAPALVSVAAGNVTPLVGTTQLGMDMGNLQSPGLATPRALGLVGGLHGMSMQQPQQSIYASGGSGTFSPQLPMLSTNFNLAMVRFAWESFCQRGELIA